MTQPPPDDPQKGIVQAIVGNETIAELMARVAAAFMTMGAANSYFESALVDKENGRIVRVKVRMECDYIPDLGDVLDPHKIRH